MLIQNKYRVTKLIGEGSYSRVYEAIHDTKKTRVAIKIDLKNNDIATRLMEHEIRMYLYLKKFVIDNIVPMKSFGVYDDHHYIIMEYLPFTLNEYVKQIPRDKIETLFIQIELILRKLHNHNILYHDVKPDNFMVSAKGRVYLIDMGLSGCCKDVILKNTIGTPLYCSPKCHKPKYVYGKEDDMISFYYMIFHILAPIELPWNNICVDDERIRKRIMYELKKYTNMEHYYRNIEDPLLHRWIRKFKMFDCKSLLN
jgi:serine/threonine protein kinase